VLADGDTTYYAITNDTDWEVGIGTYSTTGPTLARTTILASSSGGSAVNWGVGVKNIFISYAASKAVYLDASGDVLVADKIVHTGDTNTAIRFPAADTMSVETGGAERFKVENSTITTTIPVLLPADPTLALQAATKQYVDTLVASGIHFHQPVRVENPANLNATYDNGTAGVGATLTNAGTQVALVIDGVTVDVDDRVLVYEQTDQTQNGVYVVTDTGSGSTNWVLTRSDDADTYVINDANGLSEGSTVFVQQGTTGAGETYTCNTSGVITFGTTNITFAQISNAQIYSAGSGLALTGTVFSNTAPDQTVTLTQGGATTITGTYPNFTITSVNTTYTAGGGIGLVADEFSVTAGSGLTQDADGLSHADTSSQGSVDNTGATFIQDVSLDGFGHVTSLASTTITTALIGAANAASPVFTGDVSIADKIVHTGDTNTAIRFPAADTVTVETSGAERLRITSAGNVGIGTSSPSEMLQVTGGLSADNSLIRTGLTAAFNSFLLGYAGAGDVTDEAPAIYATNTTGSTGQAGHIAYKSRSGTARDHIFYTGTTPTERLRITSAGNVGIGTTNPVAPLHIERSINEMLRLRNTTAGGGSGYISFYETGGTRVGWIGNSSSSNTNLQINNQSATGYVSINTNNTERLRINSSGNVGIGTTTPATKLDVNGSASAVFFENPQTITSNYTIVTGRSAMNTGPITIDSGVTITVESGARYVVI
jgi:hypothetical protein